jgi:hypothetical protein
MIRMLCLCFAAVAAMAPAAARAPADRSDDWLPVNLDSLRKDAWRRTSPNAFAHVRLDMNGDGVKDEALLVVDHVQRRSALKVCLAAKAPGSPADCHILAEDDDEGGYEVMGLEVRAPGCHRYTAINEGPDINGKICSKFEGLEYFRVGSSASVFFYDNKTGLFTRYWESD